MKKVMEMHFSPCNKRRGEVYRIVVIFGEATKVFGPYYDEDDAISAVVHKLNRLGEIGMLPLLRRVEVVIEEEDKRGEL
jgi:hypothetical protein